MADIATVRVELSDESKELLRQFHEDVERITVKELPMHVYVPDKETQLRALKGLVEALEFQKEES